MIKRFISFRAAVLLMLVLSLFLTAAAPYPAQLSPVEKQELVRLTIKNKNTSSITLWLKGPASYYMVIPAETTQAFTVQRGEYTATVRGCGMISDSDLDMTHQNTLVMPICGGAVNSAKKSPQKVDVSSIIKVVSVTFKNDVDSRLLVILTGPSTYVFTFPVSDDEVDYTIAKGEYTVKYWACGVYVTRTVEVYKGKYISLGCKK